MAAIDAAHARGEVDDDGWHAAMAALVVPAYLAATDERGGSGHSGSAPDWEWSRGIVAEAVTHTGTFLDVGCANGLLMESVHRWCGVEPYGLEIVPELAALARERYPQWRDRVVVGNVASWAPPRRFTYVRTGLEYVPPPHRAGLVQRLLEHVVEAGGRLVIGKVSEERGGRELERQLASWGHLVSGSAERAHTSDARLVYRVVWIDAHP